MTLFDEALHRFIYNPTDGVLINRYNINSRALVGCVAGTISSSTGYRYVQISKKLYPVQNIIWLLEVGNLPVDRLDHVDRDRLNNRFNNLREVTQQQNTFNTTLQKRRFGKLLGTKMVKSGRYQSRIVVDGFTHYLGTYNTQELAYSAYLSAKQRFHKI